MDTFFTEDAAISKLSAARMGYFRDELIHFFVRRPTRRSPLINRGYWTRVNALRRLLRQFLEAGGPNVQKQVLSIGAGFDTTYFQLKGEGQAPHLYVEVDFPEIVQRKRDIISQHSQLYSILELGATPPGSHDSGDLHASGYHLIGLDLRKRSSLDDLVRISGLDLNTPTFILAECVLVYMEPSESECILSWLAKSFQTAAFANYEMILPDDPFGKSMLENIQARGCSLLGYHACGTLDLQKKRFLSAGWDSAHALDMMDIYSKCLDSHDRSRVEKLEIFDELEEWRLMQQHYCISWAIRQPQDSHLLDSVGLVAKESAAQEVPFQHNRRAR
mmetsp:Transcript_47993/g.79859  ORF Transcript_47993/g.79859 Transcript_47993/m.79859 type:complete len:332 (-) Transcript_47993:598-1593(-)